jgi:hypothetical protein
MGMAVWNASNNWFHPFSQEDPMIKRFARMLGATAVLMALSSGVASALYQPPSAAAEPTCWFCVSEGGQMYCMEVVCPS